MRTPSDSRPRSQARHRRSPPLAKSPIDAACPHMRPACMTAIKAEQPSGQRPWQITWTPTFILLLGYLFTILTGRLPVGALVMVLALCSLLLQGRSLRVPSFLFLFAAWTMWAFAGYAMTRYPEVVGEALTEHGKVF